MDYGQGQKITHKRYLKMLPCLHAMKNVPYDCITFLPDGDENVHIESGTLSDAGDPVGGSDLGNSYHIVLFKEGEEGPTHLDQFQAILGCPLEYASWLIPAGWFGLIVRATTTTKAMADSLFNKIQNFSEEETAEA